MKEPRWLPKDLMLAVHNRQLAEHGGAIGVRDEGLLESALARPQNAPAGFNKTFDEGIVIRTAAAAIGRQNDKRRPFAVDGSRAPARRLFPSVSQV